MPYIRPEQLDFSELIACSVQCDFCGIDIMVPMTKALMECFCGERCFRLRYGGGDIAKDIRPVPEQEGRSL